MIKTFILLCVMWLAIDEIESAPSCPANSNGQASFLSINKYLLSVAAISPLNLFDGPISVTNVPMATNNPSWTIDDLQHYNYFSAAMYCPSVRHLSCCLCGEFNSTVSKFTVIENETLATLAVVTVHPSNAEIVVSFRGSVTSTNILQDAVLLQESGSNGVKLHRGFYNSIMSIYYRVVDTVATAVNSNPGFRIVVNGHSLGGSMASLFVYLATSRSQFPPRTEWGLITYGQPRTGNKAFANYMNSLGIRMARVVSRADIAAHYVPVSLLPGIQYVHHTQEVWLADLKTATFCSKSVYEDPACSNSLGPAYSILDHVQYFDLDYTVCILVDRGFLGIISIPGVPDLPKILPQLPPPVLDIGETVDHLLFQTIIPPIG